MNENKIHKIYSQVIEKINKEHIRTFSGMEKPLFFISNAYPGVWLEHVYDAVFYAAMYPSKIQLAVDTIELFMDNQKPDGQLPCYVWDSEKSGASKENCIGFKQIQECVSFAKLCLEVYKMSGDKKLLERSYTSCKAWDSWLRSNRMTTGRGLIEMFVGFDTGHDNSGRLADMKYYWNYLRDDKTAGDFLPDGDITPIIAVDMNANFYGNEMALSEMALFLGKKQESEEWKSKAAEVKSKLFELCYDPEDAFFYDVDKLNRKRKFLSCTVFHLFMERVLDPVCDKKLIDEIYTRHIKNPAEFWTNYPFPSMAISDPSWKKHTESNCWGYFSEALIALRCTRWMDFYGFSDDFDVLCQKWVESLTEHFDELKMGQELDPITGIPSKSSEWYSSCMLFYIYAVKRLKI